MKRRYSVREIITILKDDGWYLVRTKGSHRQFRHSVKSGKVTIAGNPKDVVPPGTLGHIFKQAGLDKP